MLKRICIVFNCFLLSSLWAFTQCDPGSLPEYYLYACEDNPIEVPTFGAELFSGCVLSYVMLDNSAGVFINVLDTNTNGVFERGEAEFDVPYYLYAVTGLDEDKDGFADFDHPDTRTSNFAEITFLENNPFELDLACNEYDGTVNLQLKRASLYTKFILDGAFVLHHSNGTDTLDVDGEPLQLKTNTRDLQIELLNEPSDYCYTIDNIEQLEQDCYFDLALQLRKENNTEGSYARDDTISLTIEVHNQGTITVGYLELIAHLPPGFTVLTPKWYPNDKQTEAILFFDEWLEPDTSIVFQIDLLVSESVTEGTHDPAVEIVSFRSIDGTVLADIDSTPDRDNENDLVVDNKIDDPANDEDDHDICNVKIILNETSKFPIVNHIELLSVAPNPANDQFSVNFITQKNEPVELSIYNINGQILNTLSQMSAIPDINSINMDVSHYTDGMYLIHLSTSEKTITTRFIKQ